MIDSQIWLSHKFDLLFPAALRLDGYEDFKDRFCSQYFSKDQVIYDVGGGKNPFFDLATKQRLQAVIVGVDIDAGELSKAPQDVYDRTIQTDICAYEGKQDADLIICQTLLEHVPDVGAALRAISSMLRPGGRVLVFAPCRNAAFARLNLILPENLKRKLLFTIFPSTITLQGFKSYYDKCTPRNFRTLASKNGMIVENEKLYFMSHYFSFLFPLYAIWRIWTLLASWLSGEYAESFAMVLVKKSASSG
ncbi:MAG: class I SAM-dependent methyltransferase [Methylococcales bacterium]